MPVPFTQSQPEPKIMTKPLPEILDEIEALAQQANEAANRSREFADQAATAATAAADKAVAQLGQQLADEVAGLEANIARTLDSAALGIHAVNKRIDALVLIMVRKANADSKALQELQGLTEI